MRAMFWRVAHRRCYAGRPSVAKEAAAFTWTLFFILVYGGALLSGWRPGVPEAIVGTILVGVPLTFGLAHRRIRLEARKGSDARFRKGVEANG